MAAAKYRGDIGHSFRFCPRKMEGVILLGLLVLVAILGIGLMVVGDVWNTTRQREKEEELLFIGHQFRSAIEQYSLNSPRGRAIQTYPMQLEDLLKDSRYPSTRRYLRRLYIDPMTGKDEWGLLKKPNGAIFGVYSLSEDVPTRKDNFDLADASFAGATKYSAWVFAYSPLAASNPVPASIGTNTMSTLAR